MSTLASSTRSGGVLPRSLILGQLARLRHDPRALVGVFVVFTIVLLGLLAPVIAPNDPNQISGLEALQGPSWHHLFGTDELGRDVFSRVLYGARISPLVGLAAVAISTVVGIAIGLIAGYASGIVDEVWMRAMDVLLAFPGIVLAIAIVAVLGPGLRNALLAVGISGIPYFARVVRAVVLVEREKEYVSAARAYGQRKSGIVLLEILPNIAGPVIVLATLSIAGAILTTAALSVIGLGAHLPTSEWGAMLSEGRVYLAQQWWMATFPGIAIAVTVLGVNLLGDGLRDALDPRM
jgi:peptide/nickel transport system permease protein